MLYAVIASPDFIYHLIIALGVGALVGIEREHHKGDDVVIAGIRTFPLVSVFGFLLAYLGLHAADLGLNADTSAFSLLMLIGLPIVGALAMGLLYMRYQIGVPGMTTPFALILTYLAGALVGYGLVIEAVVLSVAITFLLVSKRRLHSFAQVLDDTELISALQFITIAFIVYPLTLNLTFPAPYDILNKGQPLDVSNLFLIVIFVSSISFISFLLIRSKGATRGLMFSGIFGGLVSSEAATVSLAQLTKQRMGLMKAAASGILLANTTMFLRDLAVCAFTDPSLKTAGIVVVPLILLTLLGIFLAWRLRPRDGGKEKIEVKSPFAIWPALKFGIIIVLVSAAAVLLQRSVGSDFVFLIALGGFASSAAVTASVSTLAFLGQVDPWIAAGTILLATAISSFNKVLLTRAAGKEVLPYIQPGVIITSVAAFGGAVALIIIRSAL